MFILSWQFKQYPQLVDNGCEAISTDVHLVSKTFFEMEIEVSEDYGNDGLLTLVVLGRLEYSNVMPRYMWLNQNLSAVNHSKTNPVVRCNAKPKAHPQKLKGRTHWLTWRTGKWQDKILGHKQSNHISITSTPYYLS